jgi:C-terminal processing protease CtpA/Prc
LEIAGKLEKHGTVKRGWLGVSIQTERAGKTVRIKAIFDQSPAQMAGLKKNDVVISIDGNRIKQTSDVSRIVRSISPGKVVQVKVLRDNKPKAIRVKIGESGLKKHYQVGDYRVRVSESPLVISEMYGKLPQAKNFILYRRGSRKLGVDVLEITGGLAKTFHVREGYGLMISKVYPKSAALKSGLREGDIIVSAGRHPVRTLQDIRKRLNELRRGDAIRIEYYRKGKSGVLNIIPDRVKDEFLNWREFLSKSDFFSRYLYDSYSSGFKNLLQQKLKELKIRISRLTEKSSRISERELKQIEGDIGLLKKRLEEIYQKELMRIQNIRKRISEENRKLMSEGADILKDLERIKEKLTKKKETDRENI